MDLQTPPTLVQLAEQSLLRDQDLAISALKDLPGELYPSLFKEAFVRRRSRILRAMVPGWPFPCLPLGSLTKTPDLETLQAVLDGLDDLLTQKVAHSRCKLQVLDLCNKHRNFWKVWAGTEEADSSPRVTTKKQTNVKHRGSRMKQPLKVLADLSFWSQDLDEYQAYLLSWAGQRKGSLELCCERMQVWPLPWYTLVDVVKLDSVEELHLKACWDLSTLACFAPYLGQMNNLRSFFLSEVDEDLHGFDPLDSQLQESFITTFISQFHNLSCLQLLYVHGANFLSDHLDQVFGGLKTPLKTLAIPDCLLSERDMEHLSLCPSVGQLRNLNFSGINFSLFPHDCLKVLLERVAPTLQILILKSCIMEEFHIRSLLPALSLCSQLTWVNFYDNCVTTSTLRDLLHHVVSLSQLTSSWLPAPSESYDDDGELILERFTQICAQLMDTLRDTRQPEGVYFASLPCLDRGRRFVYHLGSLQEQYSWFL